jgi:hypothetical protein
VLNKQLHTVGLDAKTNQKKQGCADIGYRRSISAEIFQTRSQARSDREDVFTLRFRSGRDADFSEAGGPHEEPPQGGDVPP